MRGLPRQCEGFTPKRVASTLRFANALAALRAISLGRRVLMLTNVNPGLSVSKSATMLFVPSRRSPRCRPTRVPTHVPPTVPISATANGRLYHHSERDPGRFILTVLFRQHALDRNVL